MARRSRVGSIGVWDMLTRRLWALGHAVLVLTALASAKAACAAPAPDASPRVETALANIMTLERPNQDGFATVWDGNKYVQCGRAAGRALRCEAAGALMQPSLGDVLTPERIKRLSGLGWRLDPHFGNYAQTFAAGTPLSQVADRIVQALSEGYSADLTSLETGTDWVAREPCPPRNGPSQNLAGMINDAPAMATTAVHACVYQPEPGFDPRPPTLSAADLIGVYGTRVTGEIQRLRVNLSRGIFVVLSADLGYIQCEPQTSPRAIYCEAESPDSEPTLAAVLTPERLARLHAAGYANPGRAPNYSKAYPLDGTDDAAVASELLTILHDVYGYSGSPKLSVGTEKGE